MLETCSSLFFSYLFFLRPWCSHNQETTAAYTCLNSWMTRVMTTEMALDSWSRPRGSEVTVSCSVNTSLLLPLPRVDHYHASLENKMNLVSSFLNLQWQRGPTSSFLAWLKWTQHSSTLRKFSSPVISAPLSLLPAGSDPKDKCWGARTAASAWSTRFPNWNFEANFCECSMPPLWLARIHIWRFMLSLAGTD